MASPCICCKPAVQKVGTRGALRSPSTLQDVDELIIAIRVRRSHEEAGTKDVVMGVGDDALNCLSIVETNANPETLHHRCVFMEVKGTMAQVAVKSHHKEDSLSICGCDLLHLATFYEREPN